MNFGFWLSERGKLHTMKVCRHHNLQEAVLHEVKTKTQWDCLECLRLRYWGVRTGKEPGCSNFVGMHIAEKVLSKAFVVMEKVHPGEAFDFYCGHNLKVDSKCGTLTENGWAFKIERNKVPDVFCLIALDNTPVNVAEDPKPIHVWLVPGNAIIDGRPLNDRRSLTVNPRTIVKLEPWRRTDMERRIIKCCDKIKEKEGM